MHKKNVCLRKGDALLIIDVQNDFLEGGSLEVAGADRIVPVVNHYIGKFVDRACPVFATRDWHPHDHHSFTDYGGPWPPHCIAGTIGAEFPDELAFPKTGEVISKGQLQTTDGYSGFVDTSLKPRLDAVGAKRLFVAGLATDYCILNTVLDALKLNYLVFLLHDAVCAVQTETGKLAELTMQANGAKLLTLDGIE